ncbi:uncharacterized protein LOC134674175 [Cydia fagiglandana]|uniref:uncharacterized protein LOC134674175 n=1 Tax=Cydia fagiglandana TaxID=1458189 RepID=UPI002FEE4C62
MDSPSTSTHTHHITFSKLHGSKNFNNWLFSIQCLLTDQGLWEVCTKKDELTDPAEKQKDARARAKICLSCNENVYPVIRSAKTAYETLQCLKKAYADSGLTRRLALMRKLLSNKYDGNMEEYVNKSLATQQELQSIGASVEDEFLAIVMLAGLPEEFKPLVMTLEHANIAKITSEHVVTALLKEDSRAVSAASGSTQPAPDKQGPANVLQARSSKTKSKLFLVDVMDSCRCCLRCAPDKDLTTPYTHNGKTETFYDLFKECFDIHLVLGGSGSCGICWACVGRLRDASDFKLQVQRSQAELQALFAKESAVKLEQTDDGADDDSVFEVLYEEPIEKSELVGEEATHELMDVDPLVKSETDDVTSDGDLAAGTKRRAQTRKPKTERKKQKTNQVETVSAQGGSQREAQEELRRGAKGEKQLALRDASLTSSLTNILGSFFKKFEESPPKSIPTTNVPPSDAALPSNSTLLSGPAADPNEISNPSMYISNSFDSLPALPTSLNGITNINLENLDEAEPPVLYLTGDLEHENTKKDSTPGSSTKASIKMNTAKKKKPYTSIQLQNAISAVKDGMGISEASQKFCIPKATLHDKVHKKYPEDATPGAQTVLNKEEEKQLVTWILYLSDAGFPITKPNLINTVKNLVQNLKRKNSFKNGTPGRHWYEGFMARHPELSMRVSQNLTAPRAKITEESIRAWFDRIDRYFTKENLKEVLADPRRLFNCAESAFNLSPQSSVIVQSSNRVYSKIANDEKESLTVLMTVSADGNIQPPLVLFKRTPTTSITMPPKWGFGRSESGRTTGETFCEYVTNVFYPWLIGHNIPLPVILFMDHSSHINLPLSEFCREKRIILIALPSNSTHRRHPLDVAVFPPLKHLWKVYRQTNNPNTELKEEDFAKALDQCIKKASLKDAIVSGFRTCGLSPFNPDSSDYNKLIKHVKETDKTTAKDNDKDNELIKPTRAPSTFLAGVERRIPGNDLEEFRMSGETWLVSENHGLF